MVADEKNRSHTPIGVLVLRQVCGLFFMAHTGCNLDSKLQNL